MTLNLQELLAALRARIEACMERCDASGVGTPALNPAGQGEDPGSLYNRGVLLLHEFQENGQRPLIDQALAFSHEAADRIPPGHPRGGMVLSGVAAAYTARFDAFGDVANLGEAIDWGSQAVTCTSAPDPRAGRPRR